MGGLAGWWKGYAVNVLEMQTYDRRHDGGISPAAGVMLWELRRAEGKMRLSRRINFTRSQPPPGWWENVSKRVVSPEKSLCKNSPLLFTSYAVIFCHFPRENPRKQPFQIDCMVSAHRVV